MALVTLFCAKGLVKLTPRRLSDGFLPSPYFSFFFLENRNSPLQQISQKLKLIPRSSWHYFECGWLGDDSYYNLSNGKHPKAQGFSTFVFRAQLIIT